MKTARCKYVGFRGLGFRGMGFRDITPNNGESNGKGNGNEMETGIAGCCIGLAFPEIRGRFLGPLKLKPSRFRV